MPRGLDGYLPEVTDVRVWSLEERPDLVTAFGDMPTSWAEFMRHDPAAWALGSLREVYPGFHLVAVADEEPGAFARSTPFPWSGLDEDLSDQGWDDVVGRALRAHMGGRTPDAVSALEIAVHPDWQGRGLSAQMLGHLREVSRRHGFSDLVAPVRPSAKHLEPRTPMSVYALRCRDDGLPHDPWLRTHVRAGGRIVRVCPAAMCIAETLATWRSWTGMAFDTDGDVIVPSALAPVHTSLADNRAVYVEPNVWVRHRL